MNRIVNWCKNNFQPVAKATGRGRGRPKKVEEKPESTGEEEDEQEEEEEEEENWTTRGPTTAPGETTKTIPFSITLSLFRRRRRQLTTTPFFDFKFFYI